MSKKSLRREGVVHRLAKAGEARELIRTHGDATDRLAWRPAALPVDGISYIPVFDHLDAELAGLEYHLSTAEDKYTQSMVKLTALERDSAELAELVEDKQIAAQRVHIALRDFDPGGAIEIDSHRMQEEIDTGHQAVVEARLEAARARGRADEDRELADAAAIEFDQVFPCIERVRSGLMLWAGAPEIGEVTGGQPAELEEAGSGDPPRGSGMPGSYVDAFDHFVEFVGGLADSIRDLSDEEVLEEFREGGGDPEVGADEARQVMLEGLQQRFVVPG